LIINLLNPIVSGAISDSLPDERVVDAYLSTQNSSYFEVLYDRYSKKVFAKCISLLKNETKAEDATQEIFVKVLLNLSGFSGKSKFSTWLYSITYNFCIDTIRKNKKKLGVLVDDINSVGENISDNLAISDKELLETNVFRLKRVLDEIPTGDKAILLMKYQDELSIKDICEIIDKSESAVKMKIKRAKEKFKKVYDELYLNQGAA